VSFWPCPRIVVWEPLDTYLNPPKPKSAESGAADLRAMFAHTAAKQGT
jgi:hypothetical protein